jgi:hypothetical protein
METFTSKRTRQTVAGQEDDLHIKTGGSYTRAEDVWIKTSGEYRPARAVWQKIGGSWQRVFRPDVYSIVKTRSLSLEGAGVTVQAPPSANVDAGVLTPGRSTTGGFTVQSPYNESFFGSALTASASTCEVDSCATDQSFDSASDAAPDVGGETVEVEYDLGTVTANSTGSVTIKFKDSSGSVLGSRTQSFDDGQSGQTQSFQDTAPSGTVEVVIERQLTADSQDTSGGFVGCSFDSDCTNEEATIQSSITVQQV